MSQKKTLNSVFMANCFSNGTFYFLRNCRHAIELPILSTTFYLSVCLSRVCFFALKPHFSDFFFSLTTIKWFDIIHFSYRRMFHK